MSGLAQRAHRLQAKDLSVLMCFIGELMRI